MRTPTLSLTLTLALACLAAGHATASTVTYNFSQGGWSDAAGSAGR